MRHDALTPPSPRPELHSSSRFKYLGRTALIAAAYVVAGGLGLQLAVPPGHATIIWPPSGIAVAALLHYGRGHWPGVMLGALLLDVHVAGGFGDRALEPTPLLVAAALACGSTLQALVVATLIDRRFGVPMRLGNWLDVLWLILVSTVLGCLIAASIGVGTLFAAGMLPVEVVLENWLTWWMGDMIGVAVFLPIALLNPWRPWDIHWANHAAPGFTAATLLFFMVPLGLTFYAWQATTHFTFTRNQSAFETLAHDNESALQFRMASYAQSLDGAAGVFQASDYVSGSEWARYVDALDIGRSLPGINGIGYIVPVSANELEAFVKRVRDTEIPGFRVHPETDADEKFVILYINPVLPNQQAVGLDIAFEQNRFDAATHARSTGRPTITRRIILVQDDTNNPGFLLLRPLFLGDREIDGYRFMGWIYAPFIASRFMADLTQSQGTTIEIDVFDGASADPGQLIYSSDPETMRSSPPRYAVQKTIRVMEQDWTIIWRSTPAFETSVNSREPKIVLAAGVSLSFLFGALLLSFTRREETVRRLVLEKTREIELREERFRVAINHAPIGMALVALDGTFLTVNESLCNFLGYSREEFLALDYHAITSSADLAAEDALLRDLLDDKITTFQLEKRYLHRDGHQLWGLLGVSIARSADGKPAYLIAQIKDITARKEIERVKNEFVATVGHELRTPLTSIRGSLGIVTGAMASEFSEQALRMLQIAQKNCERLILLINDILDLEKISSGEAAISPTLEPVLDLVRTAIEANQGLAAQFKVALRLTCNARPVLIMVDAARFQQVLSNLISNAAKFSSEGQVVDIIVEERPDSVRISVADRGVGIPSEFRARIFSRFAQADTSATRSRGGTGLGLHISRELVQRMGGRIDFISEINVGSTFWVEFPVAEVDRTPDVRDGETNEPAIPVALHVEDDTGFSEFLAMALQGHVRVVAAGNVDEATWLLKTRKFDVLIIDPEIGGPNGLPLLAVDAPQNATTPVVLVSGSEQTASDARVRATFVKSRDSEKEMIDRIRSIAVGSFESENS